MIIEANNKKQTAVVISKNTHFFGSNKYSFYDYKMFVYENDVVLKLGDGFTKWNKLINKIKR